MAIVRWNVTPDMRAKLAAEWARAQQARSAPTPEPNEGETMTDAEMDDIEAWARVATSGPWKAGKATPDTLAVYVYGAGMEVAETQHEVDAAYIAALNPAAVLALVAEVRRIKALIQSA